VTAGGEQDRLDGRLAATVGLVAENDLIGHWLQASFRLDLIPRDKLLARRQSLKLGGLNRQVAHDSGLLFALRA
jgi:hypothetical protein